LRCKRGLQRIEILSKVIDGRMTMVSEAHMLDLRSSRCGAAGADAYWWRGVDPAQGDRAAFEQS
jgi:hypothetical protein